MFNATPTQLQLNSLASLDRALGAAKDCGALTMLERYFDTPGRIRDFCLAVSTESNTPLKTFEVTAPGFNGIDCAGDDLVFWVNARTAGEVREALRGTGAVFHGTIGADDSIDFFLPRDLDLLRSSMHQIRVGATRWNWNVSGPESLSGFVYALDGRDALSRCLTTTQSDGRLLADVLKAPADLLVGFPSNTPTRFKQPIGESIVALSKSL